MGIYFIIIDLLSWQLFPASGGWPVLSRLSSSNLLYPLHPVAQLPSFSCPPLLRQSVLYIAKCVHKVYSKADIPVIIDFQLQVYGRVAIWLTDFECLRTQTEYDDSINIKLFSLQFVNYYSSIIYIAFFKGR